MKFLIVDDHAVVRTGVAAILAAEVGDAALFEAASATAALEIAALHSDLDLVLLDLVLPGSAGIATLKAFSGRHPELPVLVLSSSEAPDDARAVLAAGALGFIPKSASPTTLLAAIRMVLAGEIYVPPLLLKPPPDQGCQVGLTHRQRDVLRLLAEGVGNKAIAHRLGLSEKTVKVHVTAILRTLNVSNRAQAVQAATAAALL